MLDPKEAPATSGPAEKQVSPLYLSRYFFPPYSRRRKSGKREYRTGGELYIPKLKGISGKDPEWRARFTRCRHFSQGGPEFDHPWDELKALEAAKLTNLHLNNVILPQMGVSQNRQASKLSGSPLVSLLTHLLKGSQKKPHPSTCPPAFAAFAAALRSHTHPHPHSGCWEGTWGFL